MMASDFLQKCLGKNGSLLRTPLFAVVVGLSIEGGIATSAQAQPYPIGTRVVTYQDPARNNRNIQTYLYYPATAPGANQPVASGQFPVVVIGHGFTMNYAPYAFWGNNLAQEGYIVAVPNTETGFSPSHSAFAADMAFLVEKLYSENNNSASPFYQRVQADACIMGHSMGGGCTYLAAQNNANVSATITFAAAETNPSAVAAAANVNCPSLVFSGSADCVTPPAQHQVPMYNALPDCKAYLSLVGGGHCNFATNNFNCSFGEFTCNPAGPPMPADTQRAITLYFVRPWLDRFLKNDYASGPLFTARFAQYEAAGKITGSIACAPLPVELISFRLRKPRKGTIRLEWRTGSEQQAARFVVERSADGQRFEALGSVAANNFPSEYTFDDNQPLLVDNFYRLRLVDWNEANTYSPILRERPDASGWRASVGLGSATLWLQSDEDKATVEHLWLFDAAGRLIWQQHLQGHSPPLQIEIPALRLGFYCLKVQSGRFSETLPLVIHR